jgi:hypothetical protein
MIKATQVLLRSIHNLNWYQISAFISFVISLGCLGLATVGIFEGVDGSKGLRTETGLALGGAAFFNLGCIVLCFIDCAKNKRLAWPGMEI